MRTTAPQKLERVHDIFRERRPALETMLAPKSVAVIGATEAEGSVGRTLIENLKTGNFGGKIIPVNLKRARVLGIPAFRKVGEVEHPIDLAVIVTPAATVPGIIGECVEAGAKGAIIISAGGRTTGEAGAELEKQVLAQARRGRMRIIGPNCLGVMRPHVGLNATFAASMALPGSVGFISQSGALCTAILDWSLRENVGFSAFVSVGSMLDVDWGDLIYYLGDDPHTRSIIVYMESIGDARSFLSAAREVALIKPIIVIKVGRTAPAAKAAASHTGSLTGSDEVLDAAFQRVGVLRVNTIAELFDMAEVLAKQPRPRAPRLAIVTNAGGPAALATDILVSTGGQIAQLSHESFEGFNQLLPPHWSRSNPVDLLGDAGAERYAKAVEIIAKIRTTTEYWWSSHAGYDRRTATPNNSNPSRARWKTHPGKLDGRRDNVRAGGEILNRAGIPTFAYPDTAARAFSYMWRYSDSLRTLYGLGPWRLLRCRSGKRGRRSDHRRARRRKRTILTEDRSLKQILASWHSRRRDSPCIERGGKPSKWRRALEGSWCSRSIPRRLRTRRMWAA
jgi:acetyltransferase